MKPGEKFKRLNIGKSFWSKETGSSMSGLIEPGDRYKLVPVRIEDCRTGDIVFCKVNGKFYTHLIKATNPKIGVQIGNNLGRIIGWTRYVYGKVIEIQNVKAPEKNPA